MVGRFSLRIQFLACAAVGSLCSLLPMITRRNDVRVLILLGLALCVGVATAQSTFDPGHKAFFELKGHRFSCPQKFTLDPQRSSGEFSLLRHDAYDLVVFVALHKDEGGPGTFEGLASRVAHSLNPKGAADYAWKRLDDYERVSQYEVAGGKLQGFNGTERIGVQIRVLRKGSGDLVVGYGWRMGRGPHQRRLFEQNGGGDSMPGWYAQAHVISSITGEPYNVVNPPGSGIAAPPPPAPRPRPN